MRFQSILKTLSLLLFPWLVVFAVPEWRGVFWAQASGGANIDWRYRMPFNVPEISIPRNVYFFWETLGAAEGDEMDSVPSNGVVQNDNQFQIPQDIPLWVRARRLSSQIQKIRSFSASSAGVSERPAPLLPGTEYVPLYPSGGIPQRISPQLRREIMDGIAVGEKAEPSNAYWPLLRVALHTFTGERTTAIAALEQAASCRYYNSYTWEELRDKVSIDKRQVKDYPEKTYLLEEFADLRMVETADKFLDYMRFPVGGLVADTQLSGNSQRALRIASDMTRVLDLIVQGQSMKREKEQAGQIALTVWQWLGGWYSLGEFQRHLGLPRSISSTYSGAGQFYIRYVQKYGTPAEVKTATGQVARIDRVNQAVLVAMNPGILNASSSPWPGYIGYGSKLQWRLLCWWWPMEIFIGLAELALAGIVIISLWGIPRNPALKPERKSIIWGAAGVVVSSGCLSLLAFRFSHTGIEATYLEGMARLGAWAIPLTVLVLAWVGNGLWRRWDAIAPVPQRHFDSDAQVKFWRWATLMAKSAPIHGAISFGLLTFGFDIWVEKWRNIPGNQIVYEYLQPLHEGALALSVIGGSFGALYVFWLLMSWRGSFVPQTRQEFIRAAWGLRTTLLWIFGISSWAYLGFHLAMMPLRASVAAELAQVIANGY